MKTLQELAHESTISVLEFNNIDYSNMSLIEMKNKVRSISAPCAHKWDRPYKGHGTRQCSKCGGLQTN